jgi:diguanylate cyclase (GGDEF)-like protein
MELKLYLRMLQKGWWIIILAALVASSSSLVVSFLTVPQYSATARFIITPSSSLRTSAEVINSLNMLDRVSVVATYVEVMNSDKILEDSLTFLNVSHDSIKDYTVQAVALPSSSVLELTVTGSDPKLVAELSNAIGQQTIVYANSINFILAINFLDTATQPGSPVSPQPLRDAGTALILGIVVGSSLAIVSEQIRIPLESFRQRTRLDTLTGVYNVRYFRQVVEEEITRDVDGELSVGIIELTGMKDLMESLPSSGFQYLLNKVTGILRKELRGNDIIGRWNDISFIVMLPATPSIAAKRTYDRIYQALSQEIILSAFDVAINLDPHIGGAVYSNAITAQDLFVKAESSLEQAYLSAQSPVSLWELNTPFWVERDSQ